MFDSENAIELVQWTPNQNELRLNLVGDLFSLEPLHPRGMSLHRRREPKAKPQWQLANMKSVKVRLASLLEVVNNQFRIYSLI